MARYLQNSDSNAVQHSRHSSTRPVIAQSDARKCKMPTRQQAKQVKGPTLHGLQGHFG